jgi:rare lipoprotein A
MRSIVVGFLLLGLAAPACAGEHHKIKARAKAKGTRGVACVYANNFVGQRTANGDRLDTEHLTAAHPRLPFGTMLEVVNRSNGRKAVVRINDRGPFSRHFLIDLSPAAASALGMGHTGTAPVELHLAERSAKRG